MSTRLLGGYPPGVAAWFVDTCRLKPTSRVLVAGPLAADLAAHADVEPYDLPGQPEKPGGVAALRAGLRGRAGSRRGTAKRDVGGQTAGRDVQPAEAIIVAEAGHRLDAAGYEDLAGHLLPGGRLGLCWSLRDDRYGFVRRLERLLPLLAEDEQRYRAGLWREHLVAAGFVPPRQQVFQAFRIADPDDIAGALADLPVSRALPASERRELRRALGAELALQARADGLIELPGRVDCYWTERT